MRDEDYLALKAAKKAAKRAKAEAAGVDPKPSKKHKNFTEAPVDPAPTPLPALPTKVEVEEAAPAEAKSLKIEEAAPEAKKPKGTDDGFVDQTLSCVQCGTGFVFSASEQRFFKEKGWTSAKSRCAWCTAEKKARFGESSGKGTAAQQRAAKTKCYTCGELGHNSKECKQATCYNCGQTGHRSKDCKEPRTNQAGGGVCFKFQSGSCTRGDSCRFAHIKE